MKSLGKCIGNVALHKILLNHTKRPESKKHITDEITDYSADAFEKAQEYSWNCEEKEEIREKAVKRIKNLMKHYPDLVYKEKEAIKFIEETMDEMMFF